MEFKGTKGKWYIGTAELIGNDKEFVVVSPITPIETENGYRNICSISFLEDFDEEDNYNAQLISKVVIAVKAGDSRSDEQIRQEWILKHRNQSMLIRA